MWNSKMKNYLLIHGAWGGAWEFEDVSKRLSNDGSKVTTIDLPGHGNNQHPINQVTMDAYVNEVINAINKLDTSIILVGHSLAGAIISQVAEAIPEKIEKLIYVAAMLPKSGDTPLALMQGDKDGELLANLIFSEDQSYVTIKADTVHEILLHDVKDSKLVDSVIPHFMMKQSTQPFMAEAKLTKEKFGKVAKYYIRASLDKVLSLSLQCKMITNWPVKKVFTLESGHFPLTSIPAKLVDVIQEIG